MGKPVYVAIPSAADYAAFSALCAPPFGSDGYTAFCCWLDRENEARQERHVRTIEVPLDVNDLEQWLAGRQVNEALWLTYAASRAAQADPDWPPETRPSSIWGESDFFDTDSDSGQ
jgi:hypothetical protein